MDREVAPPLQFFIPIFLSIRGMFKFSSGARKPMDPATDHLLSEFEQMRKEGKYTKIVEPNTVIVGNWSRAGMYRNPRMFCKEHFNTQMANMRRSNNNNSNNNSAEDKGSNPSSTSSLLETVSDDCIGYVELMPNDRKAPWVRSVFHCHRGQTYENIDGVMTVVKDKWSR